MGHRVEHGELGESAEAVAQHVVSDGESRHTVAHLVDHAGGIDAGDGRERRRHQLVQVAGPDLPVDRVDADRSGPDADLARSGVRLREVGHRQDLRSAVAIERNCSHDIAFRWCGNSPHHHGIGWAWRQ